MACCVFIKSPGNNYFASVGPSIIYQSNQGPGGAGTVGIFGFDYNPRVAITNPGSNQCPAISITDITDGTSNTIAFGEWRTGDFNCNALTIPQDVINPVVWPGIPTSGPWVGTAVDDLHGLAEYLRRNRTLDHHAWWLELDVQHELSGPELGPGHLRLQPGQHHAGPQSPVAQLPDLHLERRLGLPGNVWDEQLPSRWRQHRHGRWVRPIPQVEHGDAGCLGAGHQVRWWRSSRRTRTDNAPLSPEIVGRRRDSARSRRFSDREQEITFPGRTA